MLHDSCPSISRDIGCVVTGSVVDDDNLRIGMRVLCSGDGIADRASFILGGDYD
jgi:hypothetical protein